MRRCPACGGFFKGDVCLNTDYHEQDAELLPPLPAFQAYPELLVGTAVWCDWPDQGRVPCLIASYPDENGEIALMILSANIRRNIDDLHMTGDE